MALQLGRSELGAFRAIERSAARWVAHRTKAMTSDWASTGSRVSYGFGWASLAAGVLLAGFGIVPFLGGAAIAGVGAVLLVASTGYDQYRSRREAVAKEYPTDLHAVCAYISARIDAVEAERLGDKGEVTLLLQRVEAMRADAAAIHRKIGQRAAKGGSSSLISQQDLDSAAQVLKSFDQDLAELRRFADALRAAFTAARGEIQGLINPESDFNLKRRLIELQASTGQVHQEVRELIAGSVSRIHGALGQIQSDLKDLLVETGVQAALAMPLEGDIHAGIAAREEIIRTFVRRAHALEIPFRTTKSTTATTEGGVA